jgi:hypothetical protein
MFWATSVVVDWVPRLGTASLTDASICVHTARILWSMSGAEYNSVTCRRRYISVHCSAMHWPLSQLLPWFRTPWHANYQLFQRIPCHLHNPHKKSSSGKSGLPRSHGMGTCSTAYTDMRKSHRAASRMHIALHCSLQLNVTCFVIQCYRLWCPILLVIMNMSSSGSRVASRMYIRVYMGVDIIMEILKNWGLEFVLVTLKERQLATLMFFRLFTLCSAHASALVIVLSNSPCERIGKWETCPILKEDRSLVRV